MYILKTKGKITYYTRRRDLVRDCIVELINKMNPFKRTNSNVS